MQYDCLGYKSFWLLVNSRLTGDLIPHYKDTARAKDPNGYRVW